MGLSETQDGEFMIMQGAPRRSISPMSHPWHRKEGEGRCS